MSLRIKPKMRQTDYKRENYVMNRRSFLRVFTEIAGAFIGTLYIFGTRRTTQMSDEDDLLIINGWIVTRSQVSNIAGVRADNF